MYVGDKMEDKFLTIRDINGQIEVDTKFDEYYEDYIFVVIDKEDMSTQIANQIMQETDVNFDLEEDYDLVLKRLIMHLSMILLIRCIIWSKTN